MVFAHRLQEPPSKGKLNLKITDYRSRADDVPYVRADLAGDTYVKVRLAELVEFMK